MTLFTVFGTRRYRPIAQGLVLAIGFFAFSPEFIAQPRPKGDLGIEVHRAKDAKDFDYITFKNDPTATRQYTLKNGLTVYLTVNKNEPRIQTMIATRAG